LVTKFLLNNWVSRSSNKALTWTLPFVSNLPVHVNHCLLNSTISIQLTSKSQYCPIKCRNFLKFPISTRNTRSKTMNCWLPSEQKFAWTKK
jgi:hypothetical protein